MKIVTPASYIKIFGITPSASTVSPHRGLLVTTGASNGSMSVTLQDGTVVTNITIPANTVFILPLTVKSLTATTGLTAYGLL